jgi:hypothetical protein
MAMSDGEKESNGVMDPNLWGTLPNHIDLKQIFAKLPLREFFQLRLVCKEWNRAAVDRGFLESSFTRPLAKPYFVVAGGSWSQELVGLLSYDAVRKRWNWTRLPSMPNRRRFLEVKGLMYGFATEDYYATIHHVFDLHTRVWHRLPAVLESTAEDPFVALRVDTSVFPYAFQVVYASPEIPTQVYDSRTGSWTIKDGHRPEMAPGQSTCAEANGYMYLRTEIDGVVTYDLGNGDWGYLNAPPGDCDDYLRTIAAWQGRLFDVTVALDERTIAAWELLDHSDQKWSALMRMPEDLFAWLSYEDDPDPPVHINDVQFRTSFCGEHFVVFSWLLEEGLAERFVMGNLDTKGWEKVDIPFGACSILQECDIRGLWSTLKDIPGVDYSWETWEKRKKEEKDREERKKLGILEPEEEEEEEEDSAQEKV